MHIIHWLWPHDLISPDPLLLFSRYDETNVALVLLEYLITFKPFCWIAAIRLFEARDFQLNTVKQWDHTDSCNMLNSGPTSTEKQLLRRKPHLLFHSLKQIYTFVYITGSTHMLTSLDLHISFNTKSWKILVIFVPYTISLVLLLCSFMLWKRPNRMFKSSMVLTSQVVWCKKKNIK